MTLNKKNNPFKIPEGYLDSLSRELKDAVSLEDTIGRPDRDFTVPEGYFASLNDKITSSLTNEKKNVKLIRLVPFHRSYLAAASIAVIFVLAIFAALFSRPGNTAEKISFEDLASSEIDNYFEFNELDISTYEIAEMIPLDQVEISDMIDSPFREEQVLDYLNSNIEAFEDLNLENDE